MATFHHRPTRPSPTGNVGECKAFHWFLCFEKFDTNSYTKKIQHAKKIAFKALKDPIEVARHTPNLLVLGLKDLRPTRRINFFSSSISPRDWPNGGNSKSQRRERWCSFTSHREGRSSDHMWAMPFRISFLFLFVVLRTPCFDGFSGTWMRSRFRKNESAPNITMLV